MRSQWGQKNKQQREVDNLFRSRLAECFPGIWIQFGLVLRIQNDSWMRNYISSNTQIFQTVKVWLINLSNLCIANLTDWYFKSLRRMESNLSYFHSRLIFIDDWFYKFIWSLWSLRGGEWSLSRTFFFFSLNIIPWNWNLMFSPIIPFAQNLI